MPELTPVPRILKVSSMSSLPNKPISSKNMKTNRSNEVTYFKPKIKQKTNYLTLSEPSVEKNSCKSQSAHQSPMTYMKPKKKTVPVTLKGPDISNEIQTHILKVITKPKKKEPILINRNPYRVLKASKEETPKQPKKKIPQ